MFRGAIKASIEKGESDGFNWSLASINDPYAVCCLVIAFAMILAGKCQDKIGPARTALMLIFAGAFTIVVCGLSFLLVNPPAGYIPAEVAQKGEDPKPVQTGPANHSTISDMVRSPSFYLLWVTFFIGAGAGLMVIGSVAGLAKQSMGTMAFVAVAIMAIGNAGGRVIAGLLSDRIGRRRTLTLMLAFQGLLMFSAIPVVASGSAALLVLLATFIGFNYGSNLCLFPSFAKDYWGLKNYGMNYGALFTAWGVGGFVMGRVSEMLNAQPGGLNKSFVLAGSLLIVGTILTFFLRDRD